MIYEKFFAMKFTCATFFFYQSSTKFKKQLWGYSYSFILLTEIKWEYLDEKYSFMEYIFAFKT